MWNLVQNDPLSRPNLTAHCQSLSLCPLRHHHHNHLINHNVQHLVKHLVHPSHLVQLNHHVQLFHPNHLVQQPLWPTRPPPEHFRSTTSGGVALTDQPPQLWSGFFDRDRGFPRNWSIPRGSQLARYENRIFQVGLIMWTRLPARFQAQRSLKLWHLNGRFSLNEWILDGTILWFYLSILLK